MTTDATSAAAIIESLARQASEPKEVAENIFALVGEDGEVEFRDITDTLDSRQAGPRRKKGSYVVTTPESLIAYLGKHVESSTELWASDVDSTILAVVNAHGDDTAGWEDHTVTMRQRVHEDWTQWTKADGQMIAQVAFAEFVEDHLHNFADPVGADMLELAQSFRATTKVDFGSSQRVKSGETQLQYVEDTTASAGRKGQIAIPDEFALALQVYEGGRAYRVGARLRYRINDGKLLLGYRLIRARDVQRDAFGEAVEQVATETGLTVYDR